MQSGTRQSQPDQRPASTARSSCNALVAIARRGIAAGSVALLLCGQATASLIGTEAPLSLPATGVGIGVDGNTVGWGFSLDLGRTVSHLGIYDASGAGASANDRRIGIWNNAGDLVADATLSAGPGVGMPDADFLYVPLVVPVDLTAGELYTIGAHYTADSGPGLVHSADITTIAGFNYTGSSFVDFSGGFAKPTTDLSGTLPDGLFGPNLRFATAVTTVPEPTSLALLVLGLAVLGWKRRSADCKPL